MARGATPLVRRALSGLTPAGARRHLSGRVQASPERVLADLHELRAFGAVDHDASSRGGDGRPKGVCRPALTPPDLEARQWFASKCREAGLRVRADALGTILATGDDAPTEMAGKRLLCGSHSDSQATGGWLDGALGCIFALEAARAFRDAGLPAAIDVVNFQDEEGRFGTLTGSRAATTGHVDLEQTSLSPEWAAPKITLGQAIEAAAPQLRALGDVPSGADDASAPILGDHDSLRATYAGFFEAHIEQGRRLERAGRSVAAVSGIVGLRQLRVVVTGEANHAGSTLMTDRVDAFRGLVAACSYIDEMFKRLAAEAAPDFVWTFSVVNVEPGAPSIVPSLAECVLQFRDPDDDVLDAARDLINTMVLSGQIRLAVDDHRPPLVPTALDDRLVACVEDAMRARRRDDDANDDVDTMHSGAIHDAANLQAAGLPSAMLFVPSIKGLSHTYDEDTHEADIAHGAVVYADAAARMLGLVE